MTATTNDSEREFWNGPSGQSWVASQEEMDAQMAEVADLVISEAAPRPGDRVLDIGSGSGALSLMAAAAVGPSGRVLAADISEPLLSHAARRGAGFPQMGTFLADAQVADWPETGFDLAISRFGVMFFADPPAAFANIARALKPGGRMVFATWAPADRSPFWHVPARRATERLGPVPRVESNSPGPMGLSDMALALERLRKAGLEAVQGREVAVHLRHAGGPRAFAKLMVRIGAARRALNYHGGSDIDARAIEDAIADDFAPFAQPDGSAAIPAPINLLTARAPA